MRRSDFVRTAVWCTRRYLNMDALNQQELEQQLTTA